MFRIFRWPQQDRYVCVIAIALCVGVMSSQTYPDEPGESLADRLLGQLTRMRANMSEEQSMDAAVQREIQQLQTGVASAQSWLSKLTRNKPELKNDWGNLQIGEFESEAAFEKRKTDARAHEKREFETATQDWEAQVRKADADLRTLRLTADIQIRQLTEKRKAAKEKQRSAVQPLPNMHRTITNEDLSLPRFDRELMIFGPMSWQINPIELQSSRTPDRVRLIADGLKVQIKLPSLEAAESFKGRFAKGEIKCVIDEKIELVRVESPIVLQPEITKEEETYLTKANAGRVLGTLAVIGIAQAFGAPRDQMNKTTEVASDALELKLERSRVVVQPQQTAQGARYHLKLTHTAVRFIDASAHLVPEAEVHIETVD